MKGDKLRDDMVGMLCACMHMGTNFDGDGTAAGQRQPHALDRQQDHRGGEHGLQAQGGAAQNLAWISWNVGGIA